MSTLKDRIAQLLASEPGLTDREITERLRGRGAPQQATNEACRLLEAEGMATRARRADGRIGNYPFGTPSVRMERPAPTVSTQALSEDELKEALKRWLQSHGWSVKVAWGHAAGVDIEARKAGDRWLIEAKGCGSSQPMRVNYFLAVLGEALQRISDPHAKYSVGLPDLPQYRALWRRLPALAKQRTGLTALFANAAGDVQEDA